MFTYFNARRTNLFASHWAYQIAKIEEGISSNLKHGNLDSSRSFLDIEDAMNAYWLAAKKGRIGEVYNIGGKKNLKLRSYLSKLILLSNKKINTCEDKKLLRILDINIQIPSSKKFIKHTNWKPKISFEKSLRKLLNDCRKKVKKDIKSKKLKPLKIKK